jgi:hypothetical protein
MDRSEEIWREEQARHGWQLPPPAAWPLRLPIIRNIRGAWLHYRVEKFAGAWASVGIGIGGPNQYDLWVVYAVKRGWC